MRLTHLESLKDEDLLGRVASSGDSEALEVLLRRHETKVYGLAYRILNNRADAQEAAQDAWLHVYRKAAGFKGQSAFTTWLYTVAANAAKDQARRRARTPVPTEEAGEVAGDPGVSGSERMEVSEALARLPEDQRVAVVMRDLYGFSYEEIADAAGVPPGTVKSRIARGRAALAGILAEGEPEAPEGTSKEAER